MRFSQRSRCQCNVFKSHFVNLIHHHTDNPVSLPKMVVEAHRHTVVCLAFYQCLANILHKFRMLVVHHRADNGSGPPEGYAVLIAIPLKGFLSGDLQNLIRNLSANRILHFTAPPYKRPPPWPTPRSASLHHRKRYQSSFHPP